MIAGRKPKPAHLRVIEGKPGHRPIRMGPQAAGSAMPDPPDHLNEIAREEWARVADGLHAIRLLETVDRAALAAYCQAYARWVQAERGIAVMAQADQLTGGLMIKTSKGNAIQNPLVGTANKAAADVIRYAAEFGMTPSARVRLAVPGAAPASKFSGLIGGAGSAQTA